MGWPRGHVAIPAPGSRPAGRRPCSLMPRSRGRRRSSRCPAPTLRCAGATPPGGPASRGSRSSVPATASTAWGCSSPWRCPGRSAVRPPGHRPVRGHASPANAPGPVARSPARATTGTTAPDKHRCRPHTASPAHRRRTVGPRRPSARRYAGDPWPPESPAPPSTGPSCVWVIHLGEVTVTGIAPGPRLGGWPEHRTTDGAVPRARPTAPGMQPHRRTSLASQLREHACDVDRSVWSMGHAILPTDGSAERLIVPSSQRPYLWKTGCARRHRGPRGRVVAAWPGTSAGGNRRSVRGGHRRTRGRAEEPIRSPTDRVPVAGLRVRSARLSGIQASPWSCPTGVTVGQPVVYTAKHRPLRCRGTTGRGCDPDGGAQTTTNVSSMSHRVSSVAEACGSF